MKIKRFQEMIGSNWCDTSIFNSGDGLGRFDGQAPLADFFFTLALHCQALQWCNNSIYGHWRLLFSLKLKKLQYQTQLTHGVHNKTRLQYFCFALIFISSFALDLDFGISYILSYFKKNFHCKCFILQKVPITLCVDQIANSELYSNLVHVICHTNSQQNTNSIKIPTFNIMLVFSLK